MTANWLATMKFNFTNEWLALSPKEAHQILAKIKQLTQDPTPDAKVKKQLKHLNPSLHRIRCGDYRIFYTFEHPYISLLALRRRKEDTYEEDIDAEFLGGYDASIAESKPGEASVRFPTQFPTTPADPLPEPITVELLINLRIASRYHAALLTLQTEQDLIDCQAVPSQVLEKLMEYLFPRPLREIMQDQPEMILQEVDDLMRFKEGELLGFLLRLSPEQEGYVNWAMNTNGPTLLKGDPGTGKSLIALYRVRVLLHHLRQQGQSDVRILFTTYTNALINLSDQLLKQLLGPDRDAVEVQTADRIAISLLARAGKVPAIIEHGEARYILNKAIETTHFNGDQAIERLSPDYLHQEIHQVIVARQLHTLEEYLVAARPGRKLGLNALQRRAVWCVYETYRDLLARQGKATWRQIRARAEECLVQGIVSERYDAVIVDEAQDLDPSALRLLVRLCVSPNRLFVTADANQSIYGSGFTWNDVHANLRFQGRTAILHTNYRSTREIGEAAQSYLAGGTLDTELVERSYINRGERPVLRVARSATDEVQTLAQLLSEAARACRLGMGACAIFCPTQKAGQVLAMALTRHGLPATFMSGQALDLERPGIKVMTLSSSKGLEFPVVALAGFLSSASYGYLPPTIVQEERSETFEQRRRTIFVGMTRAMRRLLVIIPAGTKSPLLTGFDKRYWNRE
ncbi:DNA helicase [Reticulibacter mediterranei]|uniref:DNA 3'-5' helicase n=1 Tax=Reticulibacter mediterranei TaxID=2778369 RepID=A0A8J3IK30_9CHLR|nr:UvrD-helicase domain-containing protein [Reticulibacter mediterranei]GHO93898.1 DNA helicase [Reticulibacter mediterranei]